MGGAYLRYLFSCGNSGGLSWPSVIEHRVFTPTMSSHPPFCSRYTATASTSVAAVSTTTEYAAAAASRSTVYDLDDDEDDSRHSQSSSSDGDDSVVVVGKKPAARLSRERLHSCASREKSSE